jgi:hypothetical protein
MSEGRLFGGCLTFLRGQNSFLILLVVALSCVMIGFQNCAPSHPPTDSTPADGGTVHKIDTDPETFSLFDSRHLTEPGQNLLGVLPVGRPLVLIVRNGHLYPNVQLIVNRHSFAVGDYLKLMGLYSTENPSVPLFYSPLSVRAPAGDLLEPLEEVRVEAGESPDPTAYCNSVFGRHRDPRKADLVIQIADATAMVKGRRAKALKVYWTLPLKIFSPAVCGSPDAQNAAN